MPPDKPARLTTWTVKAPFPVAAISLCLVNIFLFSGVITSFFNVIVSFMVILFLSVFWIILARHMEELGATLSDPKLGSKAFATSAVLTIAATLLSKGYLGSENKLWSQVAGASGFVFASVVIASLIFRHRRSAVKKPGP